MRPTVLVIEDDPLAARLLERQLEPEGYDVAIAHHGLEGLKLARTTPPSLVLLDLMLPGLDGFEVLSRLRSEPGTAGIPVIIVTAKSQATDRQTATRVGANAFLSKPFQRSELLDLVHSLVQAQEEQPAGPGAGVILIGAHGVEPGPVTVFLGLALQDRGERVTVVDFRPFSAEHCLLLDVTPRPAPASLRDPAARDQLPALTVRHPSGLHLLNNLEGTGEAGQFTPTDTAAVLDRLISSGAFVLADLPLYPPEVLQRAAERCDLLLLVARGDPATLAAARSALTLAERAGADPERISLVIVGPRADQSAAELGPAILGTVPIGAARDDPAFDVLAERLQQLRSSLPRGEGR